MYSEFAVHQLSPEGMYAAEVLAGHFTELLDWIVVQQIDPRCEAIVRTKLEEACFFAKKGLAIRNAEAL